MGVRKHVIGNRFNSIAVGALFTVVIGFGSFLLFIVQPMVARMALPRLGGAPAVWNSAMIVFQFLLLGGYAYAHVIGRLAFRRQVVIHAVLLSLAALTLPIAPVTNWAPPGWETLWVPFLFIAMIGPVFLLLSSQASLLQCWYAAVSGAGNPYRLYAASNLGSFAGLLVYPFLVEPNMGLSRQSDAWSAGFLILIVLVILAAATRWRFVGKADGLRKDSTRTDTEARAPIGRARILTWLALSAVPAGLMMSTTTLLTTDLMAMPLLWVIPLGLYLLSFSVAFSDRGDWVRILEFYAPILLLLVGGLAMISGGQSNPAIALAMVALLFVLAVVLHGRLYALRPDPRQLTSFYLIVSLGGALGGVFTALIAPLLFDWIYEHAMLLLAAALLIRRKSYLSVLGERWNVFARPGWVLVALSGAFVLAIALAIAVARGYGAAIIVLASLLILLGALLSGRRAAFTLVFLLLMLGHGGFATLELSLEGRRERSYFGVYSVSEARSGEMLQLTHGTTMHGKQWQAAGRRKEPTAYYGRTAGIGMALSLADSDARVGIVGFGAGTLACYRKPGQRWSFYEIDPLVVRFSQEGTFTFVEQCAPDARIVIGDARLNLTDEQPGNLDILAIDAFTSDAIPLHLLTQEAFAIYRKALADDGLLLIHISNRFFDLAPMIAALGENDWHGMMREDFDGLPEGLTASDWIVLAPSRDRLEQLRLYSAHWQPLPPPSRERWSDDYASLLSLF